MLPIKKITLYSNGFTSFEREAVVEQKGAHSLDLFFKTQDLDEVLRSLSCSTSDSTAQVNSVSYQSTKKEDDEAIVDVGGSNSLTSLLRSLVGTRIEVTLDLENQKIIGSLVGVEDFTPPNASENLQRTFINIFTDGCSVKTLDLLQVSNIKFLDENIRNSIQHALEAYLSQKNKDLQKVTIFTQGGEKAYTVKASYSLLAKEWLPTYRLTVDEKSNNSSLEVLAIVHNTQEEDWKDVSLTLISGSPAIPKAGGSGVASQGNMAVSIKRPGGGGTFTVRVNASDLVEVVKKKIQSVATDLRASSIALVFAGKRLEEGRTLHDYNIGADSTIHVTASNGGDGGDVPSSAPVFRLAECKNLSFFNIKTPVTVKRNQSALITILNSPLHTNKVLLFDPRQRKGNPLSSLMFQNTTGYTLEEGTIVIKQDNSTIGEANLVQMWPKDEVMFPYAIELGVEVIMDINTDITKPHQVVIKDGEMRVYKYKTQTTSYSFDNKTDRGFESVYIDHKFIDGWDLVETQEPVDITDATYRFQFQVPAGKEKRVFKVKEKSVQVDTYYLSSISKSDIEKWKKAEMLNKQVESDLAALIDIATQSATISKEIYDLETEVRECKSRQDTLRRNIEVLKDNKQQSKYVNELSAEDDKLTLLYSKIKQYTQAKQKMNQAHSEACNKVSHKYDVTYAK